MSTMGECTMTSKICLTLLCLIFWVAGTGLIFVGVEVFVTYNNVSQLTSAMYTLVPASIIIAVGVFMFLLGLIGCIGGCKESKCLLACFFTVLLIILVCEIAAGVLGFAYRGQVETEVTKGMEKALMNYTDVPVLQKEVDYVQHTLKCCGVNNYTDWFNTPWGEENPDEVPGSCCITGTANCTTSHPEEIHQRGCMMELKDLFNTYLAWIIGVAFGFALLEILGMICSCILLCRTQKDLPYTELNEGHDGGLRV